MAGWTGWPAAQTTDWSAASFIQTIYRAINQRRSISGYGVALTVPSVDDDIQGYSFFRNLQERIGELAGGGGFIVPTLGDYDGATSFPTWTWDDVKTDVLGGHDWTRKYPDGMGGVTTDFGLAQDGDYIGPWLWNEMQAVINQLIWVRAFPIGQSVTQEKEAGYYSDTETWAEVLAEAESRYAALAWTNGGGEFDQMSLRSESQAGEHYVLLRTTRAKLQGTLFDTLGLTYDADFYLWGEDTTYAVATFHPMDSGMTEGCFNLIVTEEGLNTQSADTTDYFPNPAGMPAPWPAEPGVGGQVSLGWHGEFNYGNGGSDHGFIIARYDRAGGLQDY